MGWSVDNGVQANAEVLEQTGDRTVVAIRLNTAQQPDMEVLLFPCDGVQTFDEYGQIRPPVTITQTDGSTTLTVRIERRTLTQDRKYVVVVAYENAAGRNLYSIVDWPIEPGLVVA